MSGSSDYLLIGSDTPYADYYFPHKEVISQISQRRR